MQSIVEMIFEGMRHRDGARIIEIREERLVSAINVCIDMGYKLSYLRNVCTMMVNGEVPDAPEVPHEIGEIYGAKLSEAVIAALADVRARVFLVNRLRGENERYKWKAELTILEELVARAQKICATEVAVLENQRTVELRSAERSADEHKPRC